MSEATVREWVKRGDLKGYRAGKLIRVARAELVQMMKQGPKTSEKEPTTGTQLFAILARNGKR